MPLQRKTVVSRPAGTSRKNSRNMNRPTWSPYYERVTRSRKKYTRKAKHKPDYQTMD